MADYAFPHRHLLGIEGLNRLDIETLLELGDRYVELNRSRVKHADVLAGRTLVNLFFENSTRTQGSFEIAGRRLGADVVTMPIATSSVKKGETLIDTAMTLNAMRPDLLVIRHGSSGAVKLLSRKVDCAVINAGDGTHEHPTQALLDALTIRRRVGDIGGMRIAICGDILHSRVARSNVACLNVLGARSAADCAAHADAAGRRRMGRGSLHRHAQGPRGLRCRDDAAPAAGAHGWRLPALRPRVLPLLGAGRGEARATPSRMPSSCTPAR